MTPNLSTVLAAAESLPVSERRKLVGRQPMANARLLRRAEVDLEEAREWYRAQSPLLRGNLFLG